MILLGHKQPCLLDMAVWVSRVLCSLLLLPTWPQLLPPPDSSATYYLPVCSPFLFRIWMLQLLCGLRVMTTPLLLAVQHATKRPVVSTSAEGLLESAPDGITRACPLAVSAKESGAWLHALPISSLGLRMDDNTVRIAVGLRLGSTLCRPHDCQHCGAEVDHRATHGLSCKNSEGRHYRHGAINDIIHRALITASVPSRVEPSGLAHTDGKRPDGVTMIPWQNG